MAPEVLVYTTDRCSYCDRAKALLGAKGVAFREIFIPRSDVASRRDVVSLTGRLTMPQILIRGMAVGGYDEIAELDRAGRLMPLIEAGATSG